ncbi:MAG: Hsp20/alpha crystallin family protein [Desulfotomaculum sp.]|nr:Hsp20/alpha crystallin family protein [Desulfotomaculum sp.]
MFGLSPFRRGKGEVGFKKPSELVGDAEQLFDNFVNSPFFPAFYADSKQMKADIKENTNEYLVEIELPGIKKEEIDINLSEDLFTVSVNREEQHSEEKENYLRQERRSGSISRTFHVENIAEDGVTAKFENGVLFMTLPKKEATPPKGKKIDIL